MLNPTFPKSAKLALVGTYVAPHDIAQHTLIGNESYETGSEYRLQSVYGEEIWLKLERAGFSPKEISEKVVLEVCAGTGFLTNHLLSRCIPKSLTVNDISPKEMAAAKQLISKNHSDAPIHWVLGDMHQLSFHQLFDLIIGNSFIHHFHDVPSVFTRFSALLNKGGTFISLHEPTPMSTVVEGAKLAAYPLAVLAPGFINDIARIRYKGKPSATDIWMFEASKLRQVALQAGFSSVEIYPWHLIRALIVQRKNLHQSESKPKLSPQEIRKLSWSVRMDARLNRILPARFFGSICIVCRK